MKTLRRILYVFIDLVIASIGVALFESSIYRRLPQPATITGSYEKEFLISAGVAFILGFFVYWRLNQRTTLWVWTLGICLFAIRVVMGSDASQGIDILGILSIRTVFYSLGALTCSCTLGGFDNELAGTRQGIGSLLWILGIPSKLPRGVVEKRPSSLD